MGMRMKKSFYSMINIKFMENETIKHVITQEDLDANPALVEEGVKVGDEVELPKITELGIEAGKIHAAALAEGKTDEEALALVEAFYKDAEAKKTLESGMGTPNVDADLAKDGAALSSETHETMPGAKELTDEQKKQLEETGTFDPGPLGDGSNFEPAKEVPATPEIAPVEPAKPVDEEVVEKEVPFVNGRILDGKELTVAHWNGDRLVVETSEGTEFTLSGKELENFLLG